MKKPHNTVEIKYQHTGNIKNTNQMGMRDMQVRAYAKRSAQYLLIKAPPASGKSRALMFIALAKLREQNLKKVIVAVPERSIARSFHDTDLTSDGFFADWHPDLNLCTAGTDQGKVDAFKGFMQDDQKILICTHATLRFAFEVCKPEQFNNLLLVIDEFHHVSADVNSRLGELLRTVIKKTSAHIVAMTGTYFRGDTVPVLRPEDEALFTTVTYTYYEQLNSYQYLKTLGIGYHFYQGLYLSAILEVLDTDKKTLIHIPHIMSGESTKDKINEVDQILEMIGTIEHTDPDTGIITVARHSDGKKLKIADLVYDDTPERNKVIEYLSNMKELDDIDIIIALGMAKEGFDWPYCEQALTIGYRGSLTEVQQIIGRCTRDSPNKTHAQFTNLIALPDSSDEIITVSVNNLLKAIACSLLMEQVLTPNINFRTKMTESSLGEPGVIEIIAFKEPTSQRVKDILVNDLNDLKATILQDETIINAMAAGIDPGVINKAMIPKLIQMKYPDLSDDHVEEVRQHLIADLVLTNSIINEGNGSKFVQLANKFINIEDLSIDLIDQINPFQKAFEVLSKSLSKQTLSQIREAIRANTLKITEEEAILLWPKIMAFFEQHGVEPQADSVDYQEQRLADALIYLRKARRQQDL